jgi:hypothetical protein
VFDLVTKSLKATFTKPAPGFGVSHIAVSARMGTLAICQGKNLYLKDISGDCNSDFVTIKRDATLTACAVSHDGLSVAIGDEYGKIYHVSNPEGSSNLVI